MVSTVVIDHVLRKISAVIQQEAEAEAVRDIEKIIHLLEILASFKLDDVEKVQQMDLGVESGQQFWKNSVVSLACGIEIFFDRSTCPLDHLPRGDSENFIKYTKRLFQELEEQITKLKQYSPEIHESSGSTVVDYNPCLPMPDLQPEFIGMDMEGAKQKLARLVLDGEKQLKAVSIVGFAGLGKTTLAMEIYRQTEGAFDCHARVTLSRNPEMKQLLQHLLSQVRQEPEGSETTSLEPEQLISKIEEHLQDKRYLILLDDMWETSTEIKKALPNNSCGSRIIMTTRIKHLADGDIYEMERLGLADSENLLSREIYGAGNRCPDDWREDSYETARTYDGIPLATIAIARLVKQRLNRRILYPVVMVPEEEQANKRILLSYIDLEPCLQAHMMLLCMFPWNYQIDRNLIIRIWRAEGYASSGSRPELSAEDIFDELIDRNVILKVNQEDISQVEPWKVYYGMFESILTCSAEENFLLTSSKPQLATATKVRRLALHSSSQDLTDRMGEGKLDLDFVSYLSIFWMANPVSLDKFINLRVLDIHGWKHLKNDDLKHICKMYLLRYLSIRNTSVSVIPEAIKNLLDLETLDLRKTQVRVLPSQVGQLPKLLDLLVGSYGDPWYNARVKIPMGFRYFGSLRTLETIHLSDAWLLLNSMQHLTEVTIMCPAEEYKYSKDKLCRALKQCRELKSLTFYGSLGSSLEFLHSLHDPPSHLYKLRVTQSLVKIPEWIGTLENLVFLQIKVCLLQPSDMEMLGNIRCLQHFLLGLDYLPEHDLVIRAEFPALQRFSVDCRVPWLNFHSGAMRNLTELELKFREGPANQASVPSGIHHLLNLKRIAIYYSSWYQFSRSVKATVDAIVKAVREHPGPVKLVINGSMDVQGINGHQAMLREHASVDANSHAGTSSSMQ